MPMLAIELDDSTHHRKERRDADCFKNNLFAHVGIPLLRLNVWEIENLRGLVDKLTLGWENRCLHLTAWAEGGEALRRGTDRSQHLSNEGRSGW